MRLSRLAAVAAIGVLMLPATTTAAQAAPARDTCAVPVVAKEFDHDQTGGWWKITITMSCDWKYTKAYDVDVYNRTTKKTYFAHFGTTLANSYSKVVTIPSTPPNPRETACVDAQATVYGPREDPLGSQRTYDCFPITSPSRGAR
ncbi:hypothetical protein [Kribbella lupini]|uniref:Secreted protein n=1 Tax=Kribbella lupini TaxID=291602 RepID=A0ABP4NLG4_9ACTN